MTSRPAGHVIPRPGRNTWSARREDASLLPLTIRHKFQISCTFRFFYLSVCTSLERYIISGNLSINVLNDWRLRKLTVFIFRPSFGRAICERAIFPPSRQSVVFAWGTWRDVDRPAIVCVCCACVCLCCNCVCKSVGKCVCVCVLHTFS